MTKTLCIFCVILVWFCISGCTSPLITDNSNVDFYGKLVDQYGNPITGAQISARSDSQSGPLGIFTLFHGNAEDFYATSNRNGIFEIDSGATLILDIVKIQKNGYYFEDNGWASFDYQPAWSGKTGKKLPNLAYAYNKPEKAYIMRGWKLRPQDKIANMREEGGDSITLRSGKPFRLFPIIGFEDHMTLLASIESDGKSPNHSTHIKITVSIDSGGIIASNDAVLLNPPTSGYMPSLEKDFILHSTEQTQEMTVNFYVHDEKTNQYGAVEMKIQYPYLGADIISRAWRKI